MNSASLPPFAASIFAARSSTLSLPIASCALSAPLPEASPDVELHPAAGTSTAASTAAMIAIRMFVRLLVSLPRARDRRAEARRGGYHARSRRRGLAHKSSAADQG